MAATLTASINPVGVWGAGQTGETTITWNTGSNAPGQVYLQTAFTVAPPPAVLFDGDPTNGDLSGTKLLTVALGPTYTLILRQVSDNSVLAMLQVTADDLVQGFINRAAQEAQFSGFVAGQTISNIVVQAGADDAHITFKTSQPTIPIVTATAPDGSSAALVFPVLNGMQTDHEVRLGVGKPLAQQTTFTLTITAPGHAGYPSHDVSKVAKTTFTTGKRDAKIIFEQVQVFRGEGGFTFVFGAGDADQATNLGEPWPIFNNDFSDNDPPYWVHYEIAVPNAPRNVWVSAVGTLHTAHSGLSTLGEMPVYDGTATGYNSGDGGEQSWATNVYSIANGGRVSVGLMTGFYEVMFEVRADIYAAVTQGTTPKLPKLQDSLSKSGLRLLSGGAKAGLTGPKGKTMTVARAADGAVYRRINTRTRRIADDEGWVALTPPVAGAVTAVASGEDRIACFALDAEGHVLRADAKGEHPAREWHRVGGGRFAGAVAAVAAGDAIVLLAQDREGMIFERRVPEAGHVEAGDWHKIGTAQLGTVVARALHGHDFAVFALDREGHAIYRRHDAWHAIPGATGITLGVSEIDHDAIGLVLINDAGKMHSLVWRGFPDREPGKWKAEGDFQHWLVRPLDAPTDPAKRAPVAA